jgi:hypothetical protein
MKQKARRDRSLRRAVRRKGDHALQMCCEELEVRKLLSTMDWTNASGGSLNVASNWVNADNPSDRHVPISSDANMSIAGELFNPAQVVVAGTPYKRQSDLSSTGFPNQGIA